MKSAQHKMQPTWGRLPLKKHPLSLFVKPLKGRRLNPPQAANLIRWKALAK